MGFPHSSVSKESACNAGDLGSIPGSGRSPGKGNGSSFQYSCLENPMDRGAWWATVHGVVRVGHEWSHSMYGCVYMGLWCRLNKHRASYRTGPNSFFPAVRDVTSCLATAQGERGLWASKGQRMSPKMGNTGLFWGLSCPCGEGWTQRALVVFTLLVGQETEFQSQRKTPMEAEMKTEFPSPRGQSQTPNPGDDN